MEDVLDTICSLTEPKVIELFSHEVCWYRDSRVEGYSIRELSELFIKWAYENGYGFDFAPNCRLRRFMIGRGYV